MNAAASPAPDAAAPDLDAVHAAAARIARHVRRTPVIAAAPVRHPVCEEGRLVLKLESLQISGSFKARGAISCITALPPARLARGIITVSGGNHGLAVAYAGWMTGTATTVYLPESAAPEKAERIRGWGAGAVVAGAVWDDTNRIAGAVAAERGLTMIHPFADPLVIAGQGTIALEVLEQVPEVDTLLVAIGGGGLISGIATAARTMKPDLRVIGVEPVGAPTLHDSVRAGRLVTLERIGTVSATLAPKRSEQINLDIIARLVEDIVLVTDDDMRAAARWLWNEMGLGAELSGAAAIAALQTGRYVPVAGETVCAIVCGAGTDGIG